MSRHSHHVNRRQPELLQRENVIKSLELLIAMGFGVLLHGSPTVVLAQSGNWQTPGPIQTPTGPWLTPKPIQTPTGPWQTPRPIQGVDIRRNQCEERLGLKADTLFAFDQAVLTPQAEATLRSVGVRIQQLKPRAVLIEGYTDSVGSESYNQSLSERRAASVKKWLVARGFVSANTSVRGFGERNPVAPNTLPNGTDNPGGRQRNRRVEIVLKTCN